MSATLQQHLDESIKLELNLASLYTIFNDSFPEDEDFWWQLAMEERGHASLLQQEKKQPQPMQFFPENLLARDLQSLLDTNSRISGLIAEFSRCCPSRTVAFSTALELELSAGEAHFQEFLDSPAKSYSSDIFKQLNQEDRDHAERIRSYMQQNGIGSGNE
jgi:ferritin